VKSLAELLDLLRAEDPRPVLPDLAGDLDQLLDLPLNRARLDALVEIETELLFEWDDERRLAALLPDDPVSVLRTVTRLGAAPGLRDRLMAALGDAGVRIVSWMSPREARRAIYRLGASTFRDRAMLAWAGAGRTGAAPQWRALLAFPEGWTVPDFPISEAEFRAAGVPLGPLVEQVRREVEEWWIDLDFTDDKMAAIERLKAVVQGLVYA
jgi:poly(A) polymerase